MVNIPILDVAEGGDRAELAATLREACLEHGFFFLRGHGIEAELMRAVLEQTRQFFELPVSAKVAIKANAFNRGYTRHGEETLDPTRQKCGDTKEGFYSGPEPTEEGRDGRSFPLLGPNQWPDEALVPEFRSTIEMYRSRMEQMGRGVVRLVALALGEDASRFDGAFRAPMSFVRLLHYSSQKSDPSNGVFAAGEHSDYGMLTFLLTDGEPGLQVLVDGVWQDVSAPPGAFICNLGDMLERWSNASFKSTRHRVVNRTGRDRYSVPFFFDPDFDTVVSPLATCGEPAFPPIRSGDYLLSRYAETHADFAARGDRRAESDLATAM